MNLSAKESSFTITAGNQHFKGFGDGGKRGISGRPRRLALASAGAVGVVQVPNILKSKQMVAMDLTGCESIDAVKPLVVRKGK